MNTTTNAPQVLFLSHGGGPLPLLGDAGHLEMVETLQGIAQQLRKPSAILVISAHWEEQAPCVLSAANPPLLYDYYGFPEAAYSLQYPLHGAPALAQQVLNATRSQGFKPRSETTRGFDHGVFVPLKILYPDADIPCVQLSLLRSLDPDEHIRLGQALCEVATQGLLIIGSGFSFHNMQAFFKPDTPQSRSMNEDFENWLIETCSATELTEAQRRRRLQEWQMAPHARYCHPREEHLLPLHVCYGVAQGPCRQAYSMTILGKRASAFLW